MARVQWLAAGLLVLGVCGTVHAKQQPPIQFDIEAQEVGSALKAWAEQAGYQVLFSEPTGDRRMIAGSVRGTYGPEEALRALLDQTELRYEFVNMRTVAVGVRADRTAGVIQHVVAAPAEGGGATRPADNGKNLEEVVVTAQKRSERLQDVPVPVTAISADSLVGNNQLRLQDYYSKIPGLTYVPGSRGEPYVIIRGVSTDPVQNPTVGITVDDVPYGASTVLGGGSTAPDIDPTDLARIEVLRGPQGTLYGSSSIGGLLKFVTADPSTDGFSGRVQAGVDSVRDGSTGYSARGSVNIPLSQTWAIRASGFSRRDPGYLDNLLTGEKDVNETTVRGGRVSALWKASDIFSLKLGAFLRDSRADGSTDVQIRPALPLPGDLQTNALRGTGTYDRKSQVYSANILLTLGGVDITSVSGYTIDNFAASRDFTAVSGATAQARFGVPGAALTDDREAKKFSQEIRASGALGSKTDWLLGGFYTEERTDYVSATAAVNPTTGAVPGLLSSSAFPNAYHEYAGFADLTYHFTDRFDVQVGGREARIEPSLLQSPNQARAEGKANAFTYLVTPRWKLSEDLMIYARLASGYRVGGTNTDLPCVPNRACTVVPREYEPDKTKNYEIGTKGALLNGLLNFDASVYYIDWKDIQITLLADQGGGYRINGGAAVSKGIELSLETRPLQGMKISTWAAWNVGELSENLPARSNVSGVDGERLPNANRFSGNFALDQEFPLPFGTAMNGFVGGSVSYVSNRKGPFVAAGQPRLEFPAYARADVRAGVRNSTWTLDMFMNNVTDRRGKLTAYNFGTAQFISYIPPRMYGVSISREF